MIQIKKNVARNYLQLFPTDELYLPLPVHVVAKGPIVLPTVYATPFVAHTRPTWLCHGGRHRSGRWCYFAMSDPSGSQTGDLSR